MKRETSRVPKIATHLASVLAPLLDRFYDNYGRILHLVRLYQEQYGSGSGRRKVYKTDLLRAAVVFLHATLEDLLRGLAQLYLPNSNSDALDAIPLVSLAKRHTRPDKFALGALSSHKGKSVDQLIQESIDEYLSRVSFNDTNDIAAHLASISIPVTDVLRALFPELQELIARRHRIVHRSDLTESRGPGKQRAAPLSIKQVLRWLRASRSFSAEITALIIERELTAALGMPPDELMELAADISRRATAAERQESKLEP